MFDIGFSEILLIAVVALLVVGPKEFPALVRTAGEWVGAVRRAASSVKSEFDREVHKAEEIKRLMAREVEIAESHRATPPVHPAALASSSPPPTAPADGAAPAAAETPAPAATGKQEHGTPKT